MLLGCYDICVTIGGFSRQGGENFVNHEKSKPERHKGTQKESENRGADELAKEIERDQLLLRSKRPHIATCSPVLLAARYRRRFFVASDLIPLPVLLFSGSPFLRFALRAS